MSKPQIDAGAGPAPEELVIEDLVVGDGAEAVSGGMVEVHYVGVDFETGQEFDSSWDRGESIQFPLSGYPGHEDWWPPEADDPAGAGLRPGWHSAPPCGPHVGLRHRSHRCEVAGTA